MTATSSRIYFAALVGVLVAVAAILVLGLSGAGVVTAAAGPAAPSAVSPAQDQVDFDRSLENAGRLMTAERDAAYLDGLRSDAPGLWNDADDQQIVQMGRLGCTLAEQNGGTWTEGVVIMNSAGFDPRDTGVLVFHAVQNFCPAMTF